MLVAAIGQPFNNSNERGLYETKDGGKTWEKILYISDAIGVHRSMVSISNGHSIMTSDIKEISTVIRNGNVNNK